MFILAKTHAAIVAAKDAEIAGLMKRLEASHARYQKAVTSEVRVCLLAGERAKQIRALEAKLAVFTAPRARDAKGHFMPTKKPIDHMIEALEAL
jgi:hypothetical protein